MGVLGRARGGRDVCEGGGGGFRLWVVFGLGKFSEIGFPLNLHWGFRTWLQPLQRAQGSVSFEWSNPDGATGVGLTLIRA